MNNFLKKFPRLQSIITLIGKARVTTYAASSTYRLFLSLPPILMLLLSLIHYLPITQEDVMHLFSDTMPDGVYKTINNLISSIYNSGGAATILSSALLVVSVSASMRAIMKGFNEIYCPDKKENFLLFAVRSVIATLLFAVIASVSLVVLVYGRQIVDYLIGQFPESRTLQILRPLTRWIHYLIVGPLLTLAFMVFYHRLPAGKRSFKSQFPGALFAACSWLIFSLVYSLYVSISNKFGAYGYLGTVMIIMMWAYYCVMFFLIGGCINVALESGKSSPAKETLS